MPLIKNILKPLIKSVFFPLGVTAPISSADVAIHKKMFGSSCSLDLASRVATLKILNEEMNDIMKKVKSHEESGSLIKGVSEATRNEAKEENGGFRRMLFGNLGATLLELANINNTTSSFN